MTDYPNWFNHTAKSNFEKFLTSLAGQDSLKFLQLGVYTGDATEWLCKNVLTGVDVLLHDVDTWKGSDEVAHESIDFNEVHNIYVNKIANFDNVMFYKMSTYDYLIDEFTRYRQYDFIYIDADHTTVGVLMDAELSWPLLKSGGIMAFDDYKWGPNFPPDLTPALGIDLFLGRHEGEYETLVINEQVWIRKHDNAQIA